MNLDKLNNLISVIRELKVENINPKKLKAEFFDILEYLYVMGVTDCQKELGIDLTPKAKSLDKEYSGETIGQKFDKYVETGDTEALITLIDSEGIRALNEGGFETAELVKDEDILKTWVTMNDLRVRDTHWLLEGVTLPINEKFTTVDGDEALYPHGFSNASNNANCRCILTYRQGSL